ncbi:MAG: phosphate acyltransferase, partial [Gemmatimonadales bacterium]
RSRAAGTPARIVLPEGDDPRIVAAATAMVELGLGTPELLGSPSWHASDHPAFSRVAAHLQARRPQAVRDIAHARELAHDPLRFGAALVALGEADGCVAGAISTTADVVRAALWAIGLRPGLTMVTSAMYHGFPDGRVLTYTDIAVLPSPTADQLADAAMAAAADRRALVGDDPIVAFLSYSTKGSAGGADPERMQQALARFRTMAPDVVADGELQLDAAVVPEVARRKCPDSPVEGRANVLVFPSLDAANIAYKLTERLAGASAAGPLLQGLARPMSDLSRGASPDDIVDVIAMVALQAAARPD